VVCVQNQYGIGVRPEYDDFVRACGEQGVAFVPFYAIAAPGARRGAGGADSDEVLAVARAHGASGRSTAGVDGCTAGRMYWPPRLPATRITWPRTWPPGALRLAEDELAVLSPSTGPQRRRRGAAQAREPDQCRQGARGPGGVGSAPPGEPELSRRLRTLPMGSVGTVGPQTSHPRPA